jgi:hypothetical protein
MSKQDEVIDRSEAIIAQLSESGIKSVSYWDIFATAMDITGDSVILHRLKRELKGEQR